MKQITAHQDADSAQSGEDHRKGQTDLPHKLKGHPGIIPYIPVHDLIDDDPGDELAGYHKDHAPSHLFPEGSTPVGPDALLGTEDKAESAQHEHGPVGIAAKKDFKSIIERSAESPQQ